MKIAKWQSKNGYGEISAYGSIVDETLVEVWITSNGSGPRVVTAAEAIAKVLVEADDAGYVLTTANCIPILGYRHFGQSKTSSSK